MTHLSEFQSKASAEGSTQWPVFTAADVEQHKCAGDTWLIIDGSVYDVSRYMKHHPGGELAIRGVAGKDCTDIFKVFHTHSVIQRLLPALKCGEIKDWKPTALQQEFHAIVKKLEDEGMFQTKMSYYCLKALEQLCLLALCLLLLIPAHSYYDASQVDSSCYSTCVAHLLFLLSSFTLGIFWQQLAFLGHDFGHNSVFGKQHTDFWGSLLVTTFFGVSLAWWKCNHNIHHIHTNSIESDPDIQHMPVFAINERACRGFFSTYYEKFFCFDRLAKTLISQQHNLFYIAMAVARCNLYLQSFLVLFDSSKPVYRRRIELTAIALYWLLYSLLLYSMPSWRVALYYGAACHAICGLIHIQITLSHFSMPVYNGVGYEHNNPNHFITTQYGMTMNIDCWKAMDWFHGGLQFQVEHHLLPRLPRHNLRYAKDSYIKPFAEKHGLPYHQTGFFNANRLILQTLKKAALIARNLPPFKVSLSQSLIAGAFMAEG